MYKYFRLPGLTGDVTHRIRNPRGHRECEVAASKAKSEGPCFWVRVRCQLRAWLCPLEQD